METLTGIVIHGDGYGRKIGYPTANIEIQKPLSGVFAGTVEYEGRTYGAGLFASERRLILEAHLLDFDGDLYGKEIVAHIHRRLRESHVFDDENELRTAIARDIQAVRTYFAENKEM